MMDDAEYRERIKEKSRKRAERINWRQKKKKRKRSPLIPYKRKGRKREEDGE